jgi:peptidoglycan L-alanyl-D-glutamate endopeptidase CwlK
MADLTKLDPILRADFEQAIADFVREHPALPRPVLDCGYRSPALQNATYAQGRDTVAQVNALRHAAGADAISAADAGQKVSWARGGQSPHNYLPCPAGDIKFLDAKGHCDWHDALFHLFAGYMLRNPKIEWGGHFPAGKTDLPHFQRKGWQQLVHLA